MKRRSVLLFVPQPCACRCGCAERLTVEEARECRGRCLACFGGFCGLQTMLRKAATA